MRLAKLAYDQLTPEQKLAWDEVVAGPRKKMHGPFFIWLHSPELLSRGQKLGLYARFQSSRRIPVKADRDSDRLRTAIR